MTQDGNGPFFTVMGTVQQIFTPTSATLILTDLVFVSKPSNLPFPQTIDIDFRSGMFPAMSLPNATVHFDGQFTGTQTIPGDPSAPPIIGGPTFARLEGWVNPGPGTPGQLGIMAGRAATPSFGGPAEVDVSPQPFSVDTQQKVPPFDFPIKQLRGDIVITVGTVGDGLMLPGSATVTTRASEPTPLDLLFSGLGVLGGFKWLRQRSRKKVTNALAM